MKPTLSVITSTYNKSKYLDITLAGYRMQRDKNFELVIVNDGGTDHTEEIISKYSKDVRIRYVYQPNTGIAGARNKALEAAEGDFILIVDDDRIPSPAFVAEHRKTLEADNKTVSIGKQHRLVSFYSNLLNFEYQQWMNLFKDFPHLAESKEEVQLFTAEDLMNDCEHVLQTYSIGEFDPAMLHPYVELYGNDLDGFHFAWSKAFGGNIGYDRRHAQGVRYDTDYRGYGKEDTDLSYQLYLQGYRYRFAPKAENYHQDHPRNIREYQQHYANFRQFQDKHRSLEVYLHTLDHFGEISQSDANAFLSILHKAGSDLLPLIGDYVKRNQPSNPQHRQPVVQAKAL